MISLSSLDRQTLHPQPVLRWSPTTRRRIEAVRERIMRGIGSTEPLIPTSDEERALLMVTVQWRKPLSFEEIAQMADTPDVRRREGRP